MFRFLFVGIASFRDRYILTIDSKAVDSQSAEACRILLFDPNSGQLVFDQNIEVNQQSDNIFTSQYKNYIQGNILPESTSKPRFLAVQDDNIYIADLGMNKSQQRVSQMNGNVVYFKKTNVFL